MSTQNEPSTFHVNRKQKFDTSECFARKKKFPPFEYRKSLSNIFSPLVYESTLLHNRLKKKCQFNLNIWTALCRVISLNKIVLIMEKSGIVWPSFEIEGTEIVVTGVRKGEI